jgi:acyl-CoA synthetase (NDP forming)
MEKFFSPRSVAIIGASNAPFNLGRSICDALVESHYSGAVYAVNRKAEAVGKASGFVSVVDIPAEIDLAVIIVPALHVIEAARQCGEKGIKNLIIESAGFSEAGDQGRGLQNELSQVAKRYGMRFIGPNCLGVMNSHRRFCCFYGGVPGAFDWVYAKPGTVSYIVQSGGVSSLILDSFKHDIVNINKIISIGNKADVDESDVIDYLACDNTEVIGIYLENVSDGRKLIESAKRSQKPILVYKVGKTPEGAHVALSHTSGMANNDVIFDSACKQSGIVRLASIGELYSLPKIFTHMPLLKGKRIGVFSNSGAFGGIATDLLLTSGLGLATLSSGTQEKMRAAGKLYNAVNPVDLGPTMSLQTFLDIYEILLSSDEVDGLLAVPSVWQQVVIDSIIELVKLCKHHNKPAAIYIPNAVSRIIEIRTKYSIPVFESIEDAVRALVVSHQYYDRQLRRLPVGVNESVE